MPHISKALKATLSIAIVTLTIAIFVYFYHKHPEIGHALKTTKPWVLVIILLQYSLFLACLLWVYDVTLRICSKRLSIQENFQLTAYSTIVNFFGPLQSGPGVRAAYLKTKHQVKLRDYTTATLIYYGFYAIVSVLFLFLGSAYWWAAIPGALVVAAGSYGIIRFAFIKSRKADTESELRLTPRLLTELFVATVAQLSVWASIYFVELRAVHAHESIRQAVTYGGAANFALFVSLTPGAIGFREAFLEFSRRLHHIGTTTILAASFIDRAVYLLYLGLLFVLVIALHAKDRLGITSAPKSSEDQAS